MTKNNPYYKATKEIKKYAGVSENWKWNNSQIIKTNWIIYKL